MSVSQGTIPLSSPSAERENALQLGPRRKATVSDPLISHGRHFGRTVHALTNVKALIVNGLLRMGELSDSAEEDFTLEQRREHAVFDTLMKSVPGIEERLVSSSEDMVAITAELIQKGISGARSDDTKSIKGPVLEWITPLGQHLSPPLSRNVKMDRGYHHERTGQLLCPAGLDWNDAEVKRRLRSAELTVAGDQWPMFLYKNYQYDPQDPWKGLLRSILLIKAYKHIFTSPSSVEKEHKATRAGNARLHGMTRVTAASVAYVATQVRFALSSSSIFSRTDIVTDSERFYNSLLELFEDPDEEEEVCDLLVWWNRQIFPSFSSAKKLVSKDSALAKIKERRAALKAASKAASDAHAAAPANGHVHDHVGA
ncbi:hypothetical protein BV25DRAFT_1873121 [Artomyces pyxidatus]|uniref:Uncharacterized protein n=1 Tax=Artomyces pyxidatus TaxID=48021 RepID=A0ACB8SHW7_9AGAM|nr:hypothetical protein BV25DRAFT_1873121 [Artomyces pyxidatus]